MNQLITKGIILSRIDYGEADRIITLLTPDHGKLRLMARGVRKVKSKLAGGIELFSVSDITFIQGRGEIGTLVSTRLVKHYSEIVKHIERVQLGYDLIKLLNKATEDNPETVYFDLLQQTFEALDDSSIELELIKAWFEAQLLKEAGHAPNLQLDTTGQKLTIDQAYNFDYDSMAFALQDSGSFTAAHIKALRLLFQQNILALKQVDGLLEVLPDVRGLVRTFAQTYLHH
ncbi:MAG TPA: DNA repair protein RecO [Verrucomicrobiae bacterium]|nr:DNA repair protein RecO [Verrucomicrobiae bacterium]